MVYLTRYLPLGPGDVILTGAPGTFAPVKPGDHSEVSLAGIGSLGNPYAAAELPTGATFDEVVREATTDDVRAACDLPL